VAQERGAKARDADLGDAAQDAWQAVVDYAKQETIEPLRGLGRFIGRGTAGSALIAIGCVLLAVALLRALQTETGSTFTGNLSWIPYLITLAAAAGVAGLAVWAIVRNGKES